MRLHELKISKTQITDTTLLGFWELAEHLGIHKQAQNISDLCIPWLNNNRPDGITKLMANNKYREASLLKLYWHIKFRNQNWGDPLGSIQGFEAFKQSPITLWRGGGGTYDSNYTGNGWFAYTFNRDRVGAFTEYNGTRASNGPFLKKRKGGHWIIELTIPVNQLGLYIQNSLDDEVIVPASISATAKQIK